MLDHADHFIKRHVVCLALGLVSTEVDRFWENRLRRLILNILGDVDQHRTWTPGTSNVKGLLNDARKLIDVPNEVAVLHHREGHSKNVCLLECSTTDHFLWNLTGDGHERDRVHEGISDAGDEIRRARAGGGHTNAHATCNTSIALSGKHATLLVTREDRADLFGFGESLMDRH